jgi:putative transposase
MKAAKELSSLLGTATACRALGVTRASFYRRCPDKPKRDKIQRRPGRALSKTERQDVLDVLRSERFVDQTPREIYAILGSTKDSMRVTTSAV